MYNRYIPQPDGSFSKRQIPDSQRPPEPSNRPPRQEPRQERNAPQCPPEPREEPCQEPPRENNPPQFRKPGSCGSNSAGSFLRNLLPGNFDTGDLLIVLLLLIMAGDCEDGQSTALLTLALYLFM